MFFLVYFFNFINYLIYYNINFINKFYVSFNRSNFFFKKTFEDLTYLEKIILSIVNNHNLFFKSILNFQNFDEEFKSYKNNNHPFLNYLNLLNNFKKNKISKLYFLKKFYNFFKKKNFKISKNFLNFLVFFWFVKRKYFLFKNFNFLKINFFFIFLNKKNSKFKSNKLNLNYYNDWCVFMFNKKHIFRKIFSNNTTLNSKKKENFEYLKKTIILFNKNYELHQPMYLKKNFFLNINIFFRQKFTFFKKKFFFNFKLDNSFKKSLSILLPIRFSNSSMNKYINFNNLKDFNFFYIRKNKIFNKGRYSRNRQLYRTGVYWCLWLNIMIVYGLYFFFYRFTFNFGYIWYGILMISFSFIFSRILKYKFYNIYYLFKEFYNLFKWFSLIFYSFLNIVFDYLSNNEIYIYKNLLIFNKNLLIFNSYVCLLNFNKFLNKKKDYGYVFIWQNYTLEDNSFLKYKSILNWFTQLYKVLTY